MLDAWMDVWKDGRVGGRKDGGWMDEGRDGWVGRKRDIWMGS
jgi:hypothetical protein